MSKSYNANLKDYAAASLDIAKAAISADYAQIEERMLASRKPAAKAVQLEPSFKAGKLESFFADDSHQVGAGMEEIKSAVLKLKKMLPPEPELVPEVAVDEETALFLAKREQEMLVFYPRKQAGGEGYGPDQTCALEPIAHFNVKDLLARFFIETHARYGEVANWRANCIGITSLYFGQIARTRGSNLHMPIFDYDGKNIKTQIRKDVKLLQKDYNLGDAWIYETRRGFHVYFFTDMVPWRTYIDMLDHSGSCKGFRRVAKDRGYSVLRISGKYTEFDIKFLYVLAAKEGQLRRMPRKAHMVRALLGLGTQCGTHFASMFPQWAHYQEDQKEWKPPIPDPKAMKGKTIRKVGMKLEPEVVLVDAPPVQVNVDGLIQPNWGKNVDELPQPNWGSQVKYVYANQGNGTAAGTGATVRWYNGSENNQ